jgi:hypothetical protein
MDDEQEPWVRRAVEHVFSVIGVDPYPCLLDEAFERAMDEGYDVLIYTNGPPDGVHSGTITIDGKDMIDGD